MQSDRHDKKPEDDKKPEENKKPAGKKSDNPKTGVGAMTSVVSTLAISMAGIVATRKRK